MRSVWATIFRIYFLVHLYTCFRLYTWPGVDCSGTWPALTATSGSAGPGMVVDPMSRLCHSGWPDVHHFVVPLMLTSDRHRTRLDLMSVRQLRQCRWFPRRRIECPWGARSVTRWLRQSSVDVDSCRPDVGYQLRPTSTTGVDDLWRPLLRVDDQCVVDADRRSRRVWMPSTSVPGGQRWSSSTLDIVATPGRSGRMRVQMSPLHTIHMDTLTLSSSCAYTPSCDWNGGRLTDCYNYRQVSAELLLE